MSNQENVVAILGCGPTAMIAAHAVKLSGRQPVMFSKEKAMSPIPGAVYLHSPIADLVDVFNPEGRVIFRKIGDRTHYARKVYGDPDAHVSWLKFGDGEERPAWSLQKAYEKLWEKYEHLIIEQSISAPDLSAMTVDYPLVISSIPAAEICERPYRHYFPRRPIWITDEAQEGCCENEIIYNGDPYDQWCRTSILFGEHSTEYPSEYPGAREGYKVMDTNCDCHPSVLRVGRFGKWQRGVLTHHAFRETWTEIFDRFEGE